MNFLNSFIKNNGLSAIGIGVIVFFLGITIAAKADSKWGYVVAALAALLVAYTVKLNFLG